MSKQNKWEKFYKNTPLEKISWQKTQADYLTKVIDTGKVKPGRALDLGCGTGIKSILLAKKGFDVTGIDISETAINYANENTKKENLEIKFIVADATDLDFLGEKKFDFILDWANLHGIPENKRDKYIKGITKHLKSGGKLVLRCFGRDESENSFVMRPMGKIYLFTKEDIEKIYSKNFKILEINISKPPNKEAPGKFFYEVLMEKL